MPNWAKSAHGGVVLVALLACLSLVLVAGCGGQTSAKSSPTPQLAPSVAATSLPGPAASLPGSTAPPGSALSSRIIFVYVNDTTTPQQRAQLAEQIAKMSEVQEFAFVSKKLGMLRFEKQLKNAAAIIAGLKGHNPFPAYFEIVLKTHSDVLPVARRFFNNPLIDNDPGTHDGVGLPRPATSPQ